MIRKTIILASIFACAAGAQAQQRTLHWRRLDVVAHLDRDGRLQVRERQAIVFDGAWNGGERVFNIRPGQQLLFAGMMRIDSAGAPHTMTRGDLAQVDHYDFTNAKTLRWRSRLPSDPPFANQEIAYEIDYTLSNILLEDKDGYKLDNDFAFPDRSGIIESFALDLDADPVWHATSLPLHLERANITPGASVVVTIPLHYTAAGGPGGVRRSAPQSTRTLLLLILLAGVAIIIILFLRGEAARGRWQPLKPASEIDRAWLRDHVFSMPPEVVGAAWDSTTGAPEVAAFIARMVQEGKLTSRVEQKKRKDILHLTLNVSRVELSEPERKLIDALFDDGAIETDTEAIRERYKKSGFNPVSIISPDIKKKVKTLVPDHRAADPLGVLVTILTVFAVIATFAIAFVATKNQPTIVMPIIPLLVGIVAIIQAGAYRNSVVNLRIKAFVLTITLVIAMLPVAGLLLGTIGANLRPTTSLLIDLVLMMLALTFLVTRIARTHEDAARLEVRRSLAAARSFFQRQLAHQHPALEDEWFPYLLAFGLGKHIDFWFRRFGAQMSDVAVLATTTAHTSSYSSSGWTGGGALFGGGGGFGGGGAGRSWASAVEGFSSGVASPGSGGSGGGGGSSGGGGGGGW